MAEFTQQETQEEKTFKSKISPFARKLADATPIDTTVAKGHEIEMWNQVSNGIAVGGMLVQRAKLIADKVKGDKIIEDMDDLHLNEVLNIKRHLKDTDIEHLDLQETVWAFDGRNEEGTPFMIGESDAKGLPSKMIKGKALEEYDIPKSQKDRIRDHYNNNEKASQRLILETLPGILLDKAKFQLATKTADLNSRFFALLSDQSNFGGAIGGHWITEAEAQRVGEFTHLEEGQIDEVPKVDRLTNKTPYTLNLTNSAEQEMRVLFKEFDDELLYLMSKGVFKPKEAIAMQREFTMGVLHRQFQIDTARNPTGAYLKIIDEGYKFNRDLNWKRKGPADTRAEKNIQTITLSEKYYSDWMLNEFSRRKQEHTSDLMNHMTEEKQNAVQNLNHELYNDKAYGNQDNTLETVTEMYKGTKIKDSVAKELALNWEFKRRAYEKGVQTRALDNLLDTVTHEVLTNTKEFLEKVSNPRGKRGGRIVKDAATLQKVILELHDKVWREQHELERGADEPGQLPKLSREQRKEITDGVKLITTGDIQKIVTTEVARNLELEKNLWIGTLAEYGDSEEGQASATAQYFEWDDSSQRYYVSDEKLEKHENRKAFNSNDEMAKPLLPLLRKINDDAKKLREKNPGLDFMKSDDFENAMINFARIQTDMILAISTNTDYQGPGEEVDQFKKAAVDFSKNNPKFKKLYDEGGLDVVLTERQRGRMQVVQKAFEDLMMYEVGLKDRQNPVKVPLLLKWRDNIQHNKNNGNYLNMYSKRLGMGIQKQLTNRIIELQDPEILETIAKECAIGDVPNPECEKARFETYQLKRVRGAIDTDRYGFLVDRETYRNRANQILQRVTKDTIAEWKELLSQGSKDMGGVD